MCGMVIKPDISGIMEMKQKQAEQEPDSSEATAKESRHFQDSDPAEPAEREHCGGTRLQNAEIFNLAAGFAFARWQQITVAITARRDSTFWAPATAA